MMRYLLAVVVLAGCAHGTELAPRSALERDVTSYAVAACLATREEPMLKDQGQGWASAIVQRGEGDIEPLTELGNVVHATAQGHTAVIHDDESPTGDAEMPVMYCGEIIDKPDVRAAMEKAMKQLAPDYEAAKKARGESTREP